MKHLTLAIVLTATTSLLFSARAHADDDAARRKEAELRFKAGLELHDRHKDAEALLQFEQAYARMPA